MKAAFINSNLALVITYQTVQMVRVESMPMFKKAFI